MTRFDGWKPTCVVALLCAITALTAAAQTFTNLVTFNGLNGSEPAYISLVQGTDGAFYGTTGSGGRSRGCCGTVFRVTPTGTITGFHFDRGTGSSPAAGVVLGLDGKFYGTTSGGGIYNFGTIFKISPSGHRTILYNFCSQTNCVDGAYPFGTLIQGSDGAFYGTTFGGGAAFEGTVFKVTPSGAFTTLYSFCSLQGCADGDEIYGGLVQGADGNFYGSAQRGGNDSCFEGCGTIFRITAFGQLTILHRFDGIDGSEPSSTLILGRDGNLYGTTFLGGDLTCDPPYGCGTVFRITPAGVLISLHSFEGTDGAGPIGAILEATDGNFYGTTSGVENGQLYNYGTVFRLTPDGIVDTLHTFDNADGADPRGGLLQATSGLFYGTTSFGGDFTCNKKSGCGTVFSLDIGLTPFVSFVRGYGSVGQVRAILGQGFVGTTLVSFDGTPANFTVSADTLLLTTVPPGATTGYVTVSTPSGTLTSNKPFIVLP